MTNNNITFHSPATEEVIRLDKEGFHYRGQFIADAGEAHRLMVEFLKQNTQPEPQSPTDEAILAEATKFFAFSFAHMGEPDKWEGTNDDLLAFARAILAHWGN